MLFIIGSDFQVEPSNWRETPKLATMNPSHCVIDCFVVCRDLALPELAKVSIAVPPPFVGSPFPRTMPSSVPMKWSVSESRTKPDAI